MTNKLIHVSGCRYAQPVGKRIERTLDGSIVKTGLVDERSKAAEVINEDFATPAEAFAYRRSADARTMFFTGTFAPGLTDAVMVPESAVTEAREHFGPDGRPVVAATKEYLAFREGPGLLPIDIDRKDRKELAAVYPDEEPFHFETIEEVEQAIGELLPEAYGCPLMIRASSSSMIADAMTGELVKGTGGWRVYIPVDDAREILRILNVLHLRCWARGKFRYAFLSAGGAILDRSFADQAMRRPTQPDYPCADLGPGLKRASNADAVYDDDGPYMTAASVTISDEERELAAANIEKARQQLAPERKKIVSGRVREHAAELVATGVSKDAAERSAVKRFEAGVLLGSDVVTLDDGVVVPVASLLGAEGRKYDGRVCFDPVEPGYDGGRPVGMIFLNDGIRPVILSFAHGSKVYHLRHDNETAMSAMNAAGCSVDAVTRILALSDLEPVEFSQREKQAVKALGLGNEKKSLRASVAQFQARMKDYASEQDDGQASERAGPYPLDVRLPVASFPHTVALEGGGVRIVDHIDNVRHVLDSYGLSFRYDSISKIVEWQHPDIEQGGDDAGTVLLSSVLSLCALNCVPRDNLKTHMNAIATSRRFNPVVDHLSSLKWDGKPRFDALADAMEADDPAICRIALRVFFIQACAAGDHAETAIGLHPDYRAHFESILVFVGGQGIGKTKGLRKLLPLKLRPRFKEGLLLNLRDKDSVIAAVSGWVVELGELEATFKKTDIAELKAFISKDTDVIRVPYGATWTEFARRTCFAGTVNDVSFLADETGNRRFVPMVVGLIDVGWRDEEIEQVWAEAWFRYASGEKWWPSAEEDVLLAANAEEYRGKTALEEAIEDAFDWGAPPRSVRVKASTVHDMVAVRGRYVGDPTMKTLKTVGTTLRRLWLATGLVRKMRGTLMVKHDDEWVRVLASNGKNRGWLLPPLVAREPGWKGDTEARLDEIKRRVG